MAYVDKEYYKNTFKGEIPDEDIESNLDIASDHIDSLTYNRIVAKGFDNLTELQKDKLKKATCLQADFRYNYGEYVDMPISGYSVSDVSLSFNSIKLNGVSTTKEVISYLTQTSLNSRRL